MSNSQLKIKYLDNHLAFVCGVFDQTKYESEPIKELISLIFDNDFKKSYNYAIYTDDYIVKQNIFAPRFHTYYLNSDAKDVILLDDKLIDIPSIYGHHRYYIYNNPELYEKYTQANPDIVFTQIKSLKDINNVSSNDR